MQCEARTKDDVSFELINNREKDRFMKGEKDVAIVSEGVSTGLSLHVSYQ